MKRSDLHIEPNFLKAPAKGFVALFGLLAVSFVTMLATSK